MLVLQHAHIQNIKTVANLTNNKAVCNKAVRLDLRGKFAGLTSKTYWRKIYQKLKLFRIELYTSRPRRVARREKTQRVFFSGSGHVYPHLDDIHGIVHVSRVDACRGRC